MSGLGKKNRSLASNWGSLKSKLSKEEQPTNDTSSSSRGKAPREKRTDLTEACKGPVYVKRNEHEKKDDKKLAGDHMNAKMKSNYVGLDCEMVGIGLSGKQSALARCCLVDFEGVVIYDKHVRPKGFVTDFRTQWSGIRKQDLRAGEAITLLECQEDVASILKGKFLVGHALKNDLDVLMLSHPRKMIRDTATFKPYMRPHGRKGGKFKPRSLKELTKQHLGIQIQSGEHDPGEDARSAVMLYRLKMRDWEDSVKAIRALQIAAFKTKLTGGVDGLSSSAVSAASAIVNDKIIEVENDVVRDLISGTKKEKDVSMSGKEKRNARRNGVPLPSHKDYVPPVGTSLMSISKHKNKENNEKKSSSMFMNDKLASSSISDIDRTMKRPATPSTSESNKKMRK
mmetsp:Transcript_25735/g.24595  ORF Transcript_25735/g.24595 Transcript_25735/m.24595 type:complete len:398 (-) Transcript_25735:293-1486(-)|eukprot:CAMPEP_0119035046 /NCGR_PEP_ID=MMETSP1177-20130426/2027_1 /TAXON_ID=2985 /ORGANISM="Ochromonas sp, Strain CCMP1899" /LENGTH=397 /DNA_ID=CAMNT_0006992929 /DNA_START=63 /DNA_END=1256 /DNA_ORIENTATION=+